MMGSEAEKEGESSGQDSNQETKSSLFQFNIKSDTRRAIIGGGLAALVTFAGASFVGEASGTEAYSLLNLSIESTRRFCGNIMIATGNILALMLTLLSLSSTTDIELDWVHYERIEEIASGVTVSFVASILIYLLLNIPLEESDPSSNPTSWIAGFYYATLVFASLLGGAVITIVLMLYNAVKDIILAISPIDDITPDEIVRDSDGNKE